MEFKILEDLKLTNSNLCNKLDDQVKAVIAVKKAKEVLKSKEADINLRIAIGEYADKPTKNAEQRAALVSIETEKEQENYNNAVEAQEICSNDIRKLENLIAIQKIEIELISKAKERKEKAELLDKQIAHELKMLELESKNEK